MHLCNAVYQYDCMEVGREEVAMEICMYACVQGVRYYVCMRTINIAPSRYRNRKLECHLKRNLLEVLIDNKKPRLTGCFSGS